MIKQIIIFLILNFLALSLGSVFTSSGVSSEWYQALIKAPWSPPGWMFGVAWTSIMICFSIYMAALFQSQKIKKVILSLYALQWALNVLWSLFFFYFNNILLGILDILALTFLIGFFLFRYRKNLNLMSLWILPYLIWLLLATSLNGYILVFN